MKLFAVCFFIVPTVLLISCNNSVKVVPEKQESVVETVESVDTVAEVEFVPPEQIPIQLYTKHELTEEDLYTDYDGGNQLADYFLIERIDYETYEANKSMAVSFLYADTMNIRKVDGILRLPSGKGEVIFVDNLQEGDNHKEYTYIGYIDELNVYLVSGIYWEDWNYFFVDKKTGKTVQTFLNMPYLSADNKYVVSIDFDNIEGTTVIDLFEVVDKKYVDPLVGMFVKKWIPVNINEPIYWANDNYLYLPVVHNYDYWETEGNYSGLAQYIRLKPIA